MPRYQVRAAPMIVDARTPEDAARRALSRLRQVPPALASLSVRPLTGTRETEYRGAALARLVGAQ